jgi:acyl-CoA dehydrogenase
MSELRTLLAETTTKVLAGLKDLPLEAAWKQICETGLQNVLTGEADGGFGGNWEDALIVVKACGHFAVALPLPETILATHLANAAKLALPQGMTTVSPIVTGKYEDGRFTGEMRSVPWGRDASHVLGVLDGHAILASIADATVERHQNPAGEPRDTLRFENAAVEKGPAQWSVLDGLALLRTAQIAGALDHTLELCVGYTRERKQFGRPLAQFQAIQQQLAILAEETAAAGMAAAAAFRAMDRAMPVLKSPLPSCGPIALHAPPPASPIRCMARWASPRNIPCTTSPAAFGRGRRRPATNGTGANSLGRRWPREGRKHFGPTWWHEVRLEEFPLQAAATLLSDGP